MLYFIFPFWLTPKHSECKETNIAQLITCKGENITNAGYLENTADFVKAITCTNVTGYKLGI